MRAFKIPTFSTTVLSKSRVLNGGSRNTTLLCKNPLLGFNRNSSRHRYYQNGKQDYNGGRYSAPKFNTNHLVILGGSAGLAGLYYVTHLETVPISGRRRMIDVSPEMEIEMGEEAWRSVKEQFKGKILPQSDIRVKRVTSVANRIINVSGLKHLKWEVIVVDNKVANAFVLPGGKICVFTGILEVATNPDELATVLSHEVAHVVARHNAEKWSITRVLLLGGYLLRFFAGDTISPGLINAAIYYGMQLPFSRRCESEADHIGLLLMSQACFHPEKAPDLWANFQKQSDRADLLKYVSTHPSHGDRIRHIQELLPQAKSLRDKSGCEHMKEMQNSVPMSSKKM